MDLEHARTFIETRHHAVMSTTRADGRPQLSPVVCAVDAAGFVVVSSRETALKVRNLRRDPQVSLCVLDDGFFGQWIQVDGAAAIDSLPEAMDGLVDYYRRVAGEHPDWDEYRASMVAERRVLLRIELARAGPDRSG
jgi:PPOX class probable F420-dependent enzyme